MTRPHARRLAATLAIVAMATVGTRPQTTQSQTTPKFDTYTGTTANMSVGAGQKLKINVLRWASDEDRNKAIASFKEKGEKQLVEALQTQPSAGYIWTDETLGYSI